MNIYDLTKLELDPKAEGNCAAFFQNELINARCIVLEAGEKIADSVVDSWVIFYVVSGEAQVTRNGETALLQEDQVFISEPAVVSLESAYGAKLMGLRISVPGETPQ